MEDLQVKDFEASLADAQHAKDGDAGGDHSLKFLSVGGAMLVWP